LLNLSQSIYFLFRLLSMSCCLLKFLIDRALPTAFVARQGDLAFQEIVLCQVTMKPGSISAIKFHDGDLPQQVFRHIEPTSETSRSTKGHVVRRGGGFEEGIDSMQEAPRPQLCASFVYGVKTEAPETGLAMGSKVRENSSFNRANACCSAQIDDPAKE
jgi:hypothetical protein